MYKNPMVYRVYRPTIAGEKRWGYFFWENDKRKCVIKNPRSGEGFLTKRDVEEWIAVLHDQNESGTGTQVKDLSRYLFLPDGQWALRQARRRDGRPLAAQTLVEHEANVRNHIVPALGEERLADIDTQTIEDFLYSLDMSNRTRRNVASTLMVVLKEAVRKRVIKAVPVFELPNKRSRKPSILILKELKALFPQEKQELARIWAPSIKGQRPHEPKEARFALAACAATMFLGGLRPQEARAVGPAQLLRKEGILLVTRSMDSAGKVRDYVKMGDSTDPRYRGTFLVDWAMKIVGIWLAVRPRRMDFLFTYNDLPLRQELFRERLRMALKRAKVDTEGRRIIPYSGRYTFETTIRPFLPPEILMPLMGHMDRAMTDHYDVPVLTERMKQMSRYKARIGKAFA